MIGSNIFNAPELDMDMVAAISAISPHIKLKPNDEDDRRFWENDQNSSCWGEFNAIVKHLKPTASVLELGPGMGRSLVFLQKMMGYHDYDVYESDGSYRDYDFDGIRDESTFCGNISQLEKVLKHNNITSYKVIDAKTHKLNSLTKKYDLIVSFYAVGFHWSLKYFWDDISKLLNNNGLAIFTVPNHFTPFPRLTDKYEIVDWASVNSITTKILIISRLDETHE